MKKEIIHKLKAIILDCAASLWEQENAIRILISFKNKWYEVWDIPDPVRPKEWESIKHEKIETKLQVYVRVFTSIKETTYYTYVSKKNPFFRLKKDSFTVPVSISEYSTTPSTITIEKEKVYKTIFYKYKETYIRFDKVWVDDFIVVEKWKDYLMDSMLLQKSNNIIWKPEYWNNNIFDEYSGENYKYSILSK